MSEPRLYRPANGSEGRDFEAEFCDRCVHDKEYRDHSRNPCVFHTAALIFGHDEPGYPREWRYNEGGQPTCTAFAFDPTSEPPGPLTIGPAWITHPPSLFCGLTVSHPAAECPEMDRLNDMKGGDQ